MHNESGWKLLLLALWLFLCSFPEESLWLCELIKAWGIKAQFPVSRSKASSLMKALTLVGVFKPSGFHISNGDDLEEPITASLFIYKIPSCSPLLPKVHQAPLILTLATFIYLCECFPKRFPLQPFFSALRSMLKVFQQITWNLFHSALHNSQVINPGKDNNEINSTFCPAH